MLALLATQVNASVVYLSYYGTLVRIIFSMHCFWYNPDEQINELLNKITSYFNYCLTSFFPEAAIQSSSYLFLQKSPPPLSPTISPLLLIIPLPSTLRPLHSKILKKS